MEFDIFRVICFFLFIGAVGKSAQIGLHTWLPDAMEGPDPRISTNTRGNDGIMLSCSQPPRIGAKDLEKKSKGAPFTRNIPSSLPCFLTP